MQFINMVTPFEQTYFDPSTTTVDPHGGVDIKAALDFDLTDEEIVRLCGAPTGSMVTVSYHAAWPIEDDDRPPAGVYFEVENPRYIRSHNVVGVFVDDVSIPSYGLYLKLIDFFPYPRAPRRMAARMLAIMVRQALLIRGLTRFRLLAAGGRSWGDLSTGERWGGYYAWPRYGFDGALLKQTIGISTKFPYYPRRLSTCRTVRDVLQVDGGSEYWKCVGDGTFMDFDLSSSSTASIQALDSVLREGSI